MTAATQTTLPKLEERSEAKPPKGELAWRIPLGSGAELVIPSETYERHRDRIDWLVRWARKVFE